MYTISGIWDLANLSCKLPNFISELNLAIWIGGGIGIGIGIWHWHIKDRYIRRLLAAMECDGLDESRQTNATNPFANPGEKLGSPHSENWS